MIEEQLSEPYGSFCDVLANWAAVQPDMIAMRDDTDAISWADMVGQIERLAARLQETGLEHGQSVAILGTSCINYALVFLAAVRAGGVAAPLTTSASKEQLSGMAADSGARHLFIDGAKSAELGADFAPGLTHIAMEDLDSWMAPAGSTAAPFTPAKSDHFNII